MIPCRPYSWWNVLVTLTAWCGLVADPGEVRAQDPSFGSSVPCAVPLVWALDDVDPRFGLSEAEVASAMEVATGLWEGATGRRLFRRGGDQPMRVALRFDDRQALVQLQREMEAELEERRVAIEARRETLDVLDRRLRAAQEDYLERVNAYESRRSAHNAEVRRWSGEADTPEHVHERLAASAEELEASRRSLQRQEEELEAAFQQLQAETNRLNEDIRALNRDSREWERAAPTRATEAGRYSETVRTVNGQVASVERRIDIHRFANRQELVWVMAHELGHALGLGHASGPGAIMSAVSTFSSGAPVDVRLHPEDAAMLRARCPEL